MALTTRSSPEPAADATTARLVGPDVTRAVALVGVVIINYHGYLNGGDAQAEPGDGFAQRLFDPWTGVLGTRFAATFMVVAGVGVTLLTQRSRTSGHHEAIAADRWRLVRRGTLLYAFGFVLDWIWSGTILFFYGAAFVVAALLFTLRIRWLVLVGTASACTAAGIRWWAVERLADGRDVDWLLQPGTLITRSPRGLLFDTFVNGTHPLLPWLAFICAGIVLGRFVRTMPYLRVAGAAATLTAATYLANHVATNGRADDRILVTVLSTNPFDRGLLYTTGTLGSAICAFCLVSWVAERTAASPVTRALQLAGQTTLTIYVLHVLVFRYVVDRNRMIGPTGLDTALVFALGFWAFAIAAAAVWRRVAGLGPLERLYRRFGG